MQDIATDGSLGKPVPMKGVTTILGDTLEKKGLSIWMAGLPLKELFGFYSEFTTPQGRKMPAGFSEKNGGTLWGIDMYKADKEDVLKLVVAASQASNRRMTQGADIGSLVHNGIEQYVAGNIEATKAIFTGFTELDPEDLKQGIKAFTRFKEWWDKTAPELVAAEGLVYSKELGYAGAFDGLLRIDGKLVLADWKTSNASVSAGAPQGVYYTYFAQSAAYAFAWEEMGNEPLDDLLIVSCRKDGEFDAVFLSELGISVDEMIAWWKAIVVCNKTMTTVKKALVNNVKEK